METAKEKGRLHWQDEISLKEWNGRLISAMNILKLKTWCWLMKEEVIHIPLVSGTIKFGPIS